MTTPSYPTALVYLDEVLEHLNLQDTNAQYDVELQGFIDAATAYIEGLTGPIVPRTISESHDGGAPAIVLYHPPVLSISSVIEYVGPVAYPLTQVELGQDIGQYSYTLDDPRSGVLHRRYTGGLAGSFFPGSGNITVTYLAGQASVPADIRMAVLQDIAGLYQSQNTTNPYFGSTDAGKQPLNPIGLFPRVEAILSAPSSRTPAIA